MIDKNANWRTHRWTFDAEYTERENAPILETLIKKYGKTFDDTYIYIFQGKTKQYILRFKHYDGARTNPRVPMEKPKDPFQKKLLSFK